MQLYQPDDPHCCDDCSRTECACIPCRNDAVCNGFTVGCGDLCDDCEQILEDRWRDTFQSIGHEFIAITKQGAVLSIWRGIERVAVPLWSDDNDDVDVYDFEPIVRVTA